MNWLKPQDCLLSTGLKYPEERNLVQDLALPARGLDYLDSSMLATLPGALRIQGLKEAVELKGIPVESDIP